MHQKVNIDIIILSYAKNEALKALTQQAVSSLLASEDPEEVVFNIVVIESNRDLEPYQFPNSLTIYPKAKFGFNRYLNVGVNATSNPYICFCNNDLIFHKKWATELLGVITQEKALSAAPFCPVTHKRDGYPFQEPYLPIYHIFSGWCFLIKRELIDIIGAFDEKFDFWYSDMDYLNTLKVHDIKNYMVTKSKVTHLGSKTSEELSAEDYKTLTAIPRTYYSYKWGHHNFFRYILTRLYLQFVIKLKLIK